ncbi:MAG TPA: hypothetical protein VFU19_10315 [Iamia sp.]|nr:hypothetical protein [Iamia sp.]
MASLPRPRLPLGDRARRTGAASRRVSLVAMVATLLALGGAVAGVYTTGVSLGARIAPSTEDDARSPGGPDPEGAAPADDTAVAGSSSTAAEPEDDSLPDRVGGGDGTTSTGSNPVTGPGGPGGPGSTLDDGTAPVEPYPGLWPYVSWQEVTAHVARGDGRFRTPSDTALRFAAEVVGLTGASIGSVDERGVVATVEVRSGRGSTLVTLTRATPGRATAATPWSVVEAVGDVTLDVPTSVAGPALRVTTNARPGVVGVHDRSRWRGIGVAPSPGAPFDVRIDPGAGGPAIVVAVAGDPRAPVSFTVRRVDLDGGAGAAVTPAPADPQEATRALVAAVGQGDVGATWELLDPAARRSVLDWRGLAGRLPALRDQLGRFAAGPLTTTAVTTPAGAVSVVATSGAAGSEASQPLAALAFRVDGGARLASTQAGAVTWTGPSAGSASVLAAGPTRPLAIVVDGTVWSSTPDGATGLRVPTDTLAPGPHLAIAVTVDGEQVTASAFPFTVPDPPAVPDSPTTETPRTTPTLVPEDGL